jgi:glycosyltransferase involved in cell wall biosynthesis
MRLRWLVVLLTCQIGYGQNGLTSFVIVTASYNNKNWYQKNLLSLFVQTYENWRLVYIDDASTDQTAQLVEQFVNDHDMRHKVVLKKNTQRMGHLYNQYYAIHECAPYEVVVVLDGDDWLAHEHVLQRLHDVYKASDVWLTYGQFWYLKKDKKGFCKPIEQDILEQGLIRGLKPFRTSHVRTFYAGLYQHIKKDDLMAGNSFMPMCADVATMMPMIEMARTHVRYIDEVLYIYNDDNQLSFFHDRRKQQEELEAIIRKKVPYEPLHKAPWIVKKDQA